MISGPRAAGSGSRGAQRNGCGAGAHARPALEPPRAPGVCCATVRIIAIVLALVLALLVFEATILVYAWSLHRAGRYDAEISWLETMQRFVPWERGMEAQIAKLYRDRVRRDLSANRVDLAMRAFREARRREMSRSRKFDRELMALGIECYTRAADHVERLGRRSQAADWDDSLFVLAIRANEPHHRFAASAAFLEGVELRVQDGRPCEALARVAWAKRGLGGEVPGLPANLEGDLTARCAADRRTGGRRR